MSIFGGRPLHIAATKEIAELLISKGADVNAKNENGQTPLFDAAVAGHKEIVELLIANGANVNAKNDYGTTPLHNSKKEIVELLIAKGADVNAKCKGGAPPLHIATTRADNETTEILISKGADVNVVDNFDFTTLDRAIQFENTKIANLLRKHGGKTAEELKAAGN